MSNRLRSNMKLKVLAALVAVVSVLCGCRERTAPQYAQELRAMAEKMDSARWDAACPAIEAVDPASLHTRSDSALYSLLAYANIKRSPRPAPAPDSLISTATDYYADGAEPRRAMMAWYFRACSNFDRGRYADAVYHAMHMLTFAEQLADTLYITRYYDLMASAFGIVNNHLESARNYTAALRYYHANPNCGDGNYLHFTRMALTRWIEAHQPDSALAVWRDNMPYFLAKDSNALSEEDYRALCMAYHAAVRGQACHDYRQIAQDYDLMESNPLADSVIRSVGFLLQEKNYYQAMARTPELVDSLIPKIIEAGIDTANLLHPPLIPRFPDVVQAQRSYILEVQEEKAAQSLRTRTIWLSVGGVALMSFIVIGGFGLHRRRMARKEDELRDRIEEVRSLCEEMESRSQNDEDSRVRLKTLSMQLFAQRLSEINKLCDTYFNHRDTGERAMSIFYHEFEREMAKLGAADSMREIERLVNECKDGLVTRLREQLPQLKETEVNFLTYIYAGFAARAVCVFMGISKDNFYMRRRRIKASITESTAPSRELFLSELG